MHDRGILAAQLQDHRRQVPGRGGHHLLARGHAAREDDLPQPRIFQEARGHRVVHGHHVHDAVGEPRPAAQLAEAEADERGRGRGLQDHGVARGHGRGHPRERDRERIVPRRDHQHDADGNSDQPGFLVDEQRDLARHRLVAQDVFGAVGQVLQGSQGGEDLDHVRLGRGLSLLARDEGRDGVGLLDHHLAEPQEQAAALGEARRRPRRERLPCRGHGFRGLRRVEERHLREGGGGGGVKGGTDAAATLHLAAADERGMPRETGYGRCLRQAGHGVAASFRPHSTSRGFRSPARGPRSARLKM